MNQSDYLAFINDLEQRFPVDRWTLSDVDVWPIIRIGLISYLDDYAKIIHKNSALRNMAFVLKDAMNYPLARIADRAHNDQATRGADVVFLTSSTKRTFTLEGRLYEPMTDPLIEQFQQRATSCFVLESGYRGDYRYPRYFGSMFLPPHMNVMAVRALVLSPLTNNQIKGLEGFDEFVKHAAIRANEVTYSIVLSLLKRVALIRRWADYFKTILEKLRPKLGFVVCYYGPLGMAFTLACRELGIVSIDLQHGGASDLNVGYVRWHKMPLKGYNVLPNVFWAWTEEACQYIRDWNRNVSNVHRPLLGGNPILSKFRDPEDRLAKQYDDILSALAKPNRLTTHVLVSLQPVHGLTPLLQETIRQSPDNIFWWIRMHPDMINRDWKKRTHQAVKSLKRTNINVEQATLLPLYTLLKRMDVHITDSSSVLIEAADFAVPSIIETTSGADFYRREVDAGIAFPAYTCEQILKTIDSLARKKKEGRVMAPQQILPGLGAAAVDELLREIGRGSHTMSLTRGSSC